MSIGLCIYRVHIVEELTILGEMIFRQTEQARGADEALPDHDRDRDGKFLLLDREPSMDVLQDTGDRHCLQWLLKVFVSFGGVQ